MEDQISLIYYGFRKFKVPCSHLRERQAIVIKVAHFPTVTNKAPRELLFAPVMRRVNISTNVLISRPSLLSIGENMSKTCFNCLGSRHVQHCKSKNVCRTSNCGRRHRSLLQESFGDNNQRMKPPSAVKFVQLHEIGQLAVVPVELSNGVKNLDT